MSNVSYVVYKPEGTALSCSGLFTFEKYSDFVSDKVGRIYKYSNPATGNPVAIDGHWRYHGLDFGRVYCWNPKIIWKRHSILPPQWNTDSTDDANLFYILAGADNTPAYSYDTKI